MTTAAPSAPASAPAAPAAAPSAPAAKPSAPARSSKPASSAPAAPAAPKAPVIESSGNGDAGGSERSMADATRRFRGGQRSAPAPQEAPEPGASIDQEGDVDPAQGGQDEAPQPTPEEEGDITDKAYQGFEDENDAGTGDPAEAPQGRDEALSILESVFGIKKGAATPEHLAGIIKDVEDTVATVRGSKSEQAASPPAAPDNQARPQNPAPASPAAPAPKDQAKPDSSGPEVPALLSDDDLRELGEYSPSHANLGKTLNQVLTLLSKAQAPDQVAALEKRLTGIERTREYEAGMRVVQRFVEHQVKQGLPAIPEAEQPDFMLEVEDYLRGRQQSGKELSPDQALQAVYMRRTREQLQQQAAEAEKRGEQKVLKSLEKRQRRFDLAGGPGSVSGGARGDDSKNAIRQATRAFRQSLAAG